MITPAVTREDEKMERGKDEVLAFLQKPRKRSAIRSLREI
jgi:hypothetical protein